MMKSQNCEIKLEMYWRVPGFPNLPPLKDGWIHGPLNRGIPRVAESFGEGEMSQKTIFSFFNKKSTPAKNDSTANGSPKVLTPKQQSKTKVETPGKGKNAGKF